MLMQNVMLDPITEISTIVTPLQFANVQVPLRSLSYVLINELSQMFNLSAIEDPFVACVVAEFLFYTCALVYCIFELRNFFFKLFSSKDS